MAESISATLLKQLAWRYATKHFNPKKKLPLPDWNVLAEVLRLSPSSYGLQPWKVVVANQPEIRKQLRAASWNQPQIEECSHLVVFTTLKKVSAPYVQRFINRIAEVRNVAPETLKEYQNMMLSDVVNGPRSAIAQHWSQRQAYIAMGMLLQAAALMGIDACPMEGLDPQKYDEILGLSAGEYSTVAVVALGYRAEDDGYQRYPKVRFDAAHVVETRS